MKEFEVSCNSLYEYSETPRVYLPFSENLVEDAEGLIAVCAEGEYYPEGNGFDLEEYIKEVYVTKNKAFKKEIKEFNDFVKEEEDEYDEDMSNYTFYEFVQENLEFSTFFNQYIKTFNSKVIAVDIYMQGFGCSGGPVCDSVTFYILDIKNEFSKMTQKKFMKLVIERCDKK